MLYRNPSAIFWSQPDERVGERGLRTRGPRPVAVGSDAARLARRLVEPDVPLAGAASAGTLGPQSELKVRGASREPV